MSFNGYEGRKSTGSRQNRRALSIDKNLDENPDVGDADAPPDTAMWLDQWARDVEVDMQQAAEGRHGPSAFVVEEELLACTIAALQPIFDSHATRTRTDGGNLSPKAASALIKSLEERADTLDTARLFAELPGKGYDDECRVRQAFLSFFAREGLVAAQLSPTRSRRTRGESLPYIAAIHKAISDCFDDDRKLKSGKQDFYEALLCLQNVRDAEFLWVDKLARLVLPNLPKNFLLFPHAGKNASPYIPSAYAKIERRDRECLLLRRDAVIKRLFCLPGGKRDVLFDSSTRLLSLEELHVTLARELEEELGPLQLGVPSSRYKQELQEKCMSSSGFTFRVFRTKTTSGVYKLEEVEWDDHGCTTVIRVSADLEPADPGAHVPSCTEEHDTYAWVSPHTLEMLCSYEDGADASEWRFWMGGAADGVLRAVHRAIGATSLPRPTTGGDEARPPPDPTVLDWSSIPPKQSLYCDMSSLYDLSSEVDSAAGATRRRGPLAVFRSFASAERERGVNCILTQAGVDVKYLFPAPFKATKFKNRATLDVFKDSDEYGVLRGAAVRIIHSALRNCELVGDTRKAFGFLLFLRFFWRCLPFDLDLDRQQFRDMFDGFDPPASGAAGGTEPNGLLSAAGSTDWEACTDSHHKLLTPPSLVFTKLRGFFDQLERDHAGRC